MVVAKIGPAFRADIVPLGSGRSTKNQINCHVEKRKEK
jgi:hypothetical protein